MAVTHWLSMIAGHKVGHRYVISKPQGTIGRGPSNVIQVFDSEVSRIHCRYQIKDNLLEISDLESANGTFVNGESTERHELSSGDYLKIGSTVFAFEVHDACVEQDLKPENSEAAIARSPKRTDQASPSSLSYFPAHRDRPTDSIDRQKSIDVEDDSGQLSQIVSDMSFFYDASLIATSQSPPQEMLSSMVGLIFHWISADRCCMLVHDQASSEFAIKAHRSIEKETNRTDPAIGEAIVDYVLEHHVGIFTSDPAADQRLTQPQRESVQQLGIREAICVPIPGRDELLGLIYIDLLTGAANSDAKRLNRDHLKLLIAVGRQMGFALDNDRYRADQINQQRHATIGKTTRSLSHHMKNVLQGINGGSHLVGAGLDNQNLDLAAKGWEIVSRNQREISKLVNDMLILGQPQDPFLRVADLNEVVSDVLGELSPVLARREIEIEWTPEPRPAVYRFDQRGIHTALLNLINSAAMVSNDSVPSKIRVSIDCPTDGPVTFLITDNGTPSKADEVGDCSFSQSDAPQRKNLVELAASRQLVESHQGDITISHPENGGNCFTVRLPLEAVISNESDLPTDH